MIALEDENRSADYLAEQLRGIESDIPDILNCCNRFLNSRNSRGEVREMLMRSDPFAFSLA